MSKSMPRFDAIDFIERVRTGEMPTCWEELLAFCEWASDRDDEAVTAEDRIAVMRAQGRRAA